MGWVREVGVLGLADRVPNLEARALSPTVGWFALVAVAAFVLLCVVHRDRWRRLWLRAEDPRTMAAFRIAFGVALLGNLAGMWGQLEFLFTDEGLFTTETARQVLGRAQFAGYGEGAGDEPLGFFDASAWLAFAKGPRYSLLFFRSDPSFFWVHLWAYVVAVLLFIAGVRTRTVGVIAYLLMGSITMRNPVYWTGADVVFRVFFFLLILGRSGHAYSIDNWLRCRRLRREGRLSEPGKAGEGAGAPASEDHPRGLEAIYRRIPAWPRLLMILQLATIYLYTGCAKTGDVWSAGDALYYALNLDHFYRLPPQLLASLFGTNLFRVFSWGVHVWQMGFSFMVVGLVVRWMLREKFEPSTGWRRQATRVLWTTFGLAVLAVVLVAFPVHYTVEDGWPSTQTMQWIIAAGWLVSMAAGAWLWVRLRDRPFTFMLLGRRRTVDLAAAVTWTLGRRLWLTIGMFFHVQILLLMNIGMFAPIMLVAYISYLNGTETASILRSIGAIAIRLRLPGSSLIRRRPVPPEDPGLPSLNTTGLPLNAAPWAYGRVGQWLATLFVVAHIGAIATWCIPDKDSCHSFRAPARRFVEPWLNVTGTRQSWGMFAPNPPRSNRFLKVLVTDNEGETWDLRTDANAPRNKATPWIFYDRTGKITRRVSGTGKWYRRWLARYYCKAWALEHDGESPRSVELVKVWYSIPKPEAVAQRGYYRPEDRMARNGREKSLMTVRCAREADAQLSNEVRARHGLSPVDDTKIHHKPARRKSKWDRQRKAKRKDK